MFKKQYYRVNSTGAHVLTLGDGKKVTLAKKKIEVLASYVFPK